jgi:uncharacterized protein (TIGR03435 family)
MPKDGSSALHRPVQLSMHRETKRVSAYALVIGKNGPKLGTSNKVTINGELKPAASEREAPQGWTMARLANYLSSVKAIGRPVLDKTGLSGNRGFILNYSTRDGDDRATVFSAVQEQLGLKLQPVKALIELFVVDHVEKAGGN